MGRVSNAAVHRPLLNIAETAQRLRVSTKTVRRMIDRGELPALRVGSQIRIAEQELESWLYADDEDVTRLKGAIRTYGHLAPDAEVYERGLLDAFDAAYGQLADTAD